MQLKSRERNIRHLLSVAGASLLSADPALAEGAGWDTDTSLFYYSEDDRVTVFEPITTARKEIGDDEFISAQLVYDSLSGATPNGALPAATAQTFTTPSCQDTYTIGAGELPMRGFSDNRVAANLGWDRPMTRTLRGQLGIRGSLESDYMSLGLSGSLLMDFNQKNTTLALGFGADGDSVQPGGGKPVGMTSIASCGGGGGGGEDTEGGLEALGEIIGNYSVDKKVSSLMLGVTQVLNRRSLLQVNLSQTRFQGYLNDPYKLVTVFDNNATNPTYGDPLDYRFESRPRSRTANSVYAQLVYGFDEDVIHVSWRHFSDDWGVESDTYELAYRLQLGPNVYLRPFYRHYQQDAADFYRHSIPNNALPAYASADQRLGAFTGITGGLRLGLQFGDRNEVYLRLATMTQTGDSHPDNAVGSQTAQDLFPDLKARFVQLGLHYDFN